MQLSQSTRTGQAQPSTDEPGLPLVEDDPHLAADVKPERHRWAPAWILLAILAATLAVIGVAVVL